MHVQPCPALLFRYNRFTNALYAIWAQDDAQGQVAYHHVAYHREAYDPLPTHRTDYRALCRRTLPATRAQYLPLARALYAAGRTFEVVTRRPAGSVVRPAQPRPTAHAQRMSAMLARALGAPRPWSPVK